MKKLQDGIEDHFYCDVDQYVFETTRSFFYITCNKKIKDIYIDIGATPNEDRVWRCESCGFLFDISEDPVCPFVLPDGSTCGSEDVVVDTRFKIVLEIYDKNVSRWRKLKDVDSFGEDAEFWDHTETLKHSGHLIIRDDVNLEVINLSKDNPPEVVDEFAYPNLYRAIYTKEFENVSADFYKYLYFIRFNIEVKEALQDEPITPFSASFRAIILNLDREDFAPPGHQYSIALAEESNWFIQGDDIRDASGERIKWNPQTGRISEGIMIDEDIPNGSTFPIWIKTSINTLAEPRSKNLIKVCVGSRSPITDVGNELIPEQTGGYLTYDDEWHWKKLVADSDNLVSFIESGVAPGSIIKIASPSRIAGFYEVESVLDDFILLLTTVPGQVTSNYDDIVWKAYTVI